jgi:hypothetical protein
MNALATDDVSPPEDAPTARVAKKIRKRLKEIAKGGEDWRQHFFDVDFLHAGVISRLHFQKVAQNLRLGMSAKALHLLMDRFCFDSLQNNAVSYDKFFEWVKAPLPESWTRTAWVRSETHHVDDPRNSYGGAVQDQAEKKERLKKRHSRRKRHTKRGRHSHTRRRRRRNDSSKSNSISMRSSDSSTNDTSFAFFDHSQLVFGNAQTPRNDENKERKKNRGMTTWGWVDHSHEQSTTRIN